MLRCIAVVWVVACSTNAAVTPAVDGGLATFDGAVAPATDGGGGGACSIALSASGYTPTCAACAQSSCCDVMTACANDPTCAACMQQNPAPTCFSQLESAADSCLSGACGSSCQSCEPNGTDCLRCSPETTNDNTYDVATPIASIQDCENETEVTGFENTPDDVDWYTFAATTNDFCGVPAIEPHAKIYATVPATTTELCVYVKRNDGNPTNGCELGTSSDEMSSLGFDGCCAPYSVRFNNYAVVSPGYDNGATIYIKVSTPGTSALCADYFFTYGYGQLGR